MEKPTRNVALVYGYAVCLVAVITFLICISSAISALSDLSDPLHAGYNFQNTPSMASYENYKMDVLKTSQPDGASKASSFTPDENTLRAMFTAAKEDRIARARHDAIKLITINIIMVLIAVVLFLTHWMWMKSRKNNGMETP